jgi:hypothetical protein
VIASDVEPLAIDGLLTEDQRRSVSVDEHWQFQQALHCGPVQSRKKAEADRLESILDGRRGRWR